MLPIQRLACVLLFIATFPAAATEIDEIDIRANFTNFWSAMSSQSYKGAATFVHPLDLSALRTQLLPIFLEAGDIPDDSVQAAVDMFFEGVPKNRRSQLSGPELFVLLFKMYEQVEPDVVEAFGAVQPEIVAIDIESNKATVTYKIRLLVTPRTEEQKAALEEVEREQDTQLFGKLNGRWYVRLDESPAQAAAELKRELGL